MVVFALAQHHGIPTRLLDWTYSSNIAAFFAAEEIRIKNLTSDRIAVWAINYRRLGNTDIKIVTHRRSKIPYLFAQSGLFMYDDLANFVYLERGSWRSFEEAFESKKDFIFEPLLRKVTLIASEAGELLRLLAVEGITRAHIMPTFDNVTETLKLKRNISVP